MAKIESVMAAEIAVTLLNLESSDLNLNNFNLNVFLISQVMHDDCDSYMKESGYSRISLTNLFNFSGDFGDE